ncbi:MAG TPA: MarR family transcriptional regulator [Cytophagales bacterium]|jgi:DNA-binding transcriptional regulator GbsR (MarR family)
MQYEEGKRQFIQTWGKLGSEWGINRTMAQVHALLLISPRPLSTEQVMEELSISRGNANMNLRDLLDWNLIHKELVPGDRKEYFVAEKDIWEVAKRIARERKRREIEPVKQVLERLQAVESDPDRPEVREFTQRMAQLNGFVGKMDSSFDTLLRADENWFFGTLLKLIK